MSTNTISLSIYPHDSSANNMYSTNHTMKFVSSFSLFCFIVLLSANLLSCVPGAKEYVLYQKDEIVPLVAIPTKPKGIEQKAADLFIKQFKLATGTDIKLLPEAVALKSRKPGQPIIFIGNTEAYKKVAPEMQTENDGFAYGHHQDSYFLAGKKGLGLLFAVAEFFEKFTNSYYIDYQELHHGKKDQINVPADQLYTSNPAFEFRQVYFRQSEDYDYTNWNKLHRHDEWWSIWGHGMQKYLDVSQASDAEKQLCYALINGKRTDEQFCFTSEVLFRTICKAIDIRIAKNPDAIFFSITPNDNTLVCQCNTCTAQNKGNNTANSVAVLLNKLAKKYPEFSFTTIAYLNASTPPNFSLEKNVIAMLSTIDYPKGQPITKTKKAAEFQSWAKSWKKVCQKLYIYDYTVQYTNYFELFPNLPALKADLLYFKELGINGVFELGSETHHAAFDEWKSFVIAKLLWNPQRDLDSLKYLLAEYAYPTHIDMICENWTRAENNIAQTGKTLNIYGTINESKRAYLIPEEFELYFYDLQEQYKNINSPNELKRMQNAYLSAIYTKLELARSIGVGLYGYAEQADDASFTISPEIKKLLNSLEELSAKTGFVRINEDGRTVQEYKLAWENYILNKNLSNKLIGKSITLLSESNGDYIGNPQRALCDGAIGFLDYEVNWLVFNQQQMQVEVPALPNTSSLSLHFLHDPKHYIFLPTHVDLYSLDAQGNKKQVATHTVQDINNMNLSKIQVSFELNQTEKATRWIIVANNRKTLPEWRYHPSRKPSIACDELFMN